MIMKREIKFRGQYRSGKHDWLYGSLITRNNRCYIIAQETFSRELYTASNGEVGIAFCEVIPETVGQLLLPTSYEYNSLGVNIWEGDIVRDWDGTRALNWEIYDNYQGTSILLDDTSSEIIGNIHDNPELLE